MEGVVAVGVVPDEVLLLCGRPSSAPSAWWTPRLDAMFDGEVARRVASASWALEEAGVRDGTTGALTGPLGAVAMVVAAATVLLQLETDRAGVTERRSVVVAPDRALLDLQEPDDGLHDLVLADPAAAAVLLCGLLADGMAPPAAATSALAGRRTAAEVLQALPMSGRRTTTRLVRTARDRSGGVSHMVTVVHHDEGSVACWTLADGGLHVTVLDDDVLVDLALVLLGAEGVEGVEAAA